SSQAAGCRIRGWRARVCRRGSGSWDGSQLCEQSCEPQQPFNKRQRHHPQGNGAPQQPQCPLNIRRLRLATTAEYWPPLLTTMVERRSTEEDAQRPGASGHHRSAIGAGCLRCLLLPAADGGAQVARKPVGQGAEAGGQPVEGIVEARGNATKMQVAGR